MSYPSAPEALDYFSYQPYDSQQMLGFEAWPTGIFAPWNTMVFLEPDTAMCESDKPQGPDLFIQTIHCPTLNEEAEFNQGTILPDPAVCEAHHIQAHDLLVQTIHRPALTEEPEFNQETIMSDPPVREADHNQAHDLLVRTIHRPALNEDPEFNQTVLPDPAVCEGDHIQAHDLVVTTIHRPALNEEPEFIDTILPDSAVCESDHVQAPDLLVQTIHRPALKVEPEFDQSAILPTDIDETREFAPESCPTRPEYEVMAGGALSLRSPSLPKGRPTRPTSPNGVSPRDGISKAKRQERNKESATKHRERLFKMIDDAWDLLPDDEKRGLDDKRRLLKLETAIGYFRKLQRKHSQILAIIG